MANITETEISSGELGILWMSYNLKTMLDQIMGKFGQHTQDPQAKQIIDYYVPENQKIIGELRNIFKDAGAIIPDGFDSRDVISGAPRLYDDIFHIMYLRVMAKTLLGINSVHLGMAYRKDIQNFYAGALKFSQVIYTMCTDYLTEQGVLPRPPYAANPNKTEYIENPKYMSGMTFGDKRALNDLEISYIFSIIESNVMGMQLITGFAQVAKRKDVREYFIEGKALAKDIINEMSTIFLESDVQMPSTWAGKATDSVVAPFSDKMMMYMSDILSSYSVGGNALGLAFNLRSDLRRKLAALTAKTLNYSIKGGKIMIEHKWLERPPQLEDRKQIIGSRQQNWTNLGV